LQSPELFNEYLAALDRAGLVGEQQNALVLLVVVVSRVLPRPMNVFVKGHSSGGKNWLVTQTLRLLPESAVAEITSASDQSWNYSHGDYRHKVVYVHEQNEALRSRGHLRPFQFRGYSHRTDVLRRYDGAVFECCRRHDQWRNLRTPAAAATFLRNRWNDASRQ